MLKIGQNCGKIANYSPNTRQRFAPLSLGPWHLGDFRNIFRPNVGEDHKNQDLSAWPLAGTAPY